MKDNNQGKSTQHYKDSMRATSIGWIGIILTVAICILLAHCNPAAEDNWDQGECGTILTKQDSLELVEPDAIYYDTLMEYMDMDCGGSDEDVMWIGGNRDTIWE
tara:strand:- start:1662 stop:1973 length:312 start_codon:yes stop_codon:yes gene_type:complete